MGALKRAVALPRTRRQRQRHRARPAHARVLRGALAHPAEGYEEDWHNADKTRTATYSGLPAGTYEFKVRAFLLESPDKYDLKSITIVVPPHFLLSKSAVWIYMILAAVIAITLLYIKEERRRRIEREYQEELKGNADSDGTDDDSSKNASSADASGSADKASAEEEVIEEAEIIED